MTVEAVSQAVERARAAFPRWSALPFAARAEQLLTVRDRMVDRTDEIVDTIVGETGKLRVEALATEVLVTGELIGWYARHGAAALAPRRVGTGWMAHKRAEIRYEPLGVVGVISPWNYPFTLSMAPLLTALLAGSTVVLKPSELTPKVGLMIRDLFDDDIVQVVTGGGEAGEALVRGGVQKIAFTGSVETGKLVMRAAADSLTPVLLELGGKDPMIVCADADLDRAAAAATWGAFSNAGQTCMAVERVYVDRTVYASFVDRVVARTALLRHGRDVGAMTHAGQLAVVERHLADAVDRGARVLAGGTVADRSRLLVDPTVLVDVDHTMEVMREETFGPLLPIMAVSGDDEALALANDSRYGLNASVWSSDRQRADRLTAGLRSGNVCVNDCMVSYALPALPFGGAKQSGLGRAHGEEGLREMSAVKSVAVDRLGLSREPQWLPVPRWLRPAVGAAIVLRHRRGWRNRVAALRNRRWH